MAVAKKTCPHEGLEATGVACPQCRAGEIVPQRGRFGPVWRCDQAGCDFWLKARPTGRMCCEWRGGRTCRSLMMQGTKTIPERCSDKDCPNHRPARVAR